ncbi:acid-sensing ion channel 4-B-like [Strongylocentrotus purpuratus]|uniref:Uncharacterized protein n=1 Tax=Strongylocentrotus purpuratus TaxID=7668 RepID=A0A7M7PL82_STRPU|nr:acid-sensing ion channel 4-B-like [Strongylocentrotus purpuratus]
MSSLDHEHKPHFLLGKFTLHVLSLFSATFGNEKLTVDNFSLALFEFGVCFTFNLDGTHRLQVRSPGATHGLEVILDVEQWNYYHQDSLPSRISAGFQLQAFDSKTSTPQVNDYGIAVGPGTKTRVGVTVHETHNIPPPHGKCGTKKLKYHDGYKVSLCQLECKTDFLVAACNCRAPYMAGPDRECNPLEIVCMNNAMEDFNSKATAACPCPRPCDVVTYATTVSQAKFPSDFYSKFLAETLTERRNISLTAAYFSNSMCLINIFFNELSRQTNTQQEAYGFYSLLCDIGGSLGMWIGGSILTLCEVLDIIGYSIYKGRSS